MLLSKTFWLTILKVAALAFVALMIAAQVPEILYDLQPLEPVAVTGPEDLTRDRFGGNTFVAVQGTPNFDHAFVYERYGLRYTYFNLDPYGLRLVVRTYEQVSDDWKNLRRFVGRLRPFEGQPFSYSIRHIYKDRRGVDIPEDAFFLALDDVPGLSGWQVGASVFGAVLWIVMFYLFFFFPWARWKGKPERPAAAAGRRDR